MVPPPDAALQTQLIQIWNRHNHIEAEGIFEEATQISKGLTDFLGELIDKNRASGSFSPTESEEAYTHLGLAVGQFTRACFLLGVDAGENFDKDVSEETIQAATLVAADLLQVANHPVERFFMSLLGGLNKKGELGKAAMTELADQLGSLFRNVEYKCFRLGLNFIVLNRT